MGTGLSRVINAYPTDFWIPKKVRHKRDWGLNNPLEVQKKPLPIRGKQPKLQLLENPQL